MDTEQVIEPTQPENGNSPNTDEELELDLELEDEPVEESKAEDSNKPKRFDDMTREEAIAAAKKLWIIRKKQGAKKPEVASPQKPNLNSNPDVLTRDEAILIAQGTSDEELKVLKRIQAGAKAEGITLSLVQAKDDEVFQAFKEKKDKERRKEKAQLGASGGATYKENVVKPGMSPEEHKELWKKAQG